ncbi:sulfite reductase flavoprotein subunit alpha [Chlamydia avium]|uniref:Oxidoreductase NAD-binding domain protein n=1 Tax=Chlamydia avium 10DC88 TaxID=1229831 RepID=W8JZ04_9CHLA|nr:sulfite reductase flavoprotein subunit alpha [Chlamydia avium]AHK62902.1 Oxidoreductase NAD-binding domain protein [Chlamydia avium 10DC88]
MQFSEKFDFREAFLTSRKLLSHCCDSNISDSIETEGHVYQLFFKIKDRPITYKVGDSLGVLPNNPEHVVDKVLESLGYSPQQSVTIQNSSITIYEFLRTQANLDKFSGKLKSFFSPEASSGSLYEAICREKPKIPINLFTQALLPLLPRFYSLASSPECNGEELELLVRLVSYPGLYEQHYGVCSFFLCKELEINTSCKVFIQPTKHFTLGAQLKNKPLIMIGAGTGIAPYKAFVQQRIVTGDSGKNILFFGERFKKANFYYQDFWEYASTQQLLDVFLAFSRDGEKKVYVQDLLKEHQDLILKTFEEGASFFVCGSKVLGQDVKKVLEDILGKTQLTQLKNEHRYVIDVY